MHARRLDESLGKRLDDLAARLRRYVTVEGVGRIVCALVILLTVQSLVDYWTRGLLWSMRAAMLLGVLVVAAYIAVRYLLNPLQRPMGRPQMANLVERKHPQLASVLISAVRFADNQVGAPASNSPELVGQVMHSAAQKARPYDFDVVLDNTRAKRMIWALVAALAFVAGMGVILPEQFSVGFARNVLLKNVAWPRRTTLNVDCQDRTIIAARGDDVVVEAYANGVQPRTVEIYYETDGGEQARETMVTVGSAGNYRYRFTRKAADEEFSFHLRGGDDRTEIHQVRLVDRPAVVAGSMLVMPPAYTGEPQVTIGFEQRSVQLLAGSTVRLSVTTNKTLKAASLLAGGENLAAADVSEAGCVAEFIAERSATLFFRLEDELGLENRRPVRFSIRVVKDEAPRVKLELPDVGDMITPEAVLPMELSASDRFGLATVELGYQVLREEPVDDSIAIDGFTPGDRNFLAEFGWIVADAGLQPPDQLTLQASAEDFDDVAGPNRAMSAEHSLRVVTRDELLGELTRREQEYRETFERLIDAQEQVRGRLLSVQASSESNEGGLAGPLSTIERQQRSLTASVEVIRQQFQQILAQLTINQIDTNDERERLDTRIIQPLSDLTRRDLAEAADAIRQWARAGGADAGVLADKIQIDAIRKMRSVLANMIQWEGYHEVVTMLRDIIRLQRELEDESEDAVLKESEDVFD